ncbi:MAG: BatA domain-containing protein [candidate division Zixibacteria bacterium]|nr:BatA domain-containing protein [candidate division Zixibacteria bacterium]
MFNFLNTAILTAAAAALLPFLLHLFSKRKVKIVPFSSIAYLKAMQKHQVRAIKIKQLLLLLIRTLIVLAVVMAFARPATKGGYLGSHASVSAVIIIDNSASMGVSSKDGVIFELSRKRAGRILDMLGQADELCLVATNGRYASPSGEDIFGNPETARDILDRIELTDGRGNLNESYATAAAVLAERLNLNREIYIISDFQESGFVGETQQIPEGYKTFLVNVADEEFANFGVESIDPGNQLIEVGTEFPLTATVKSYLSENSDDVLLSLYLDGERIAQDGLYLEAGASEAVRFDVSVNKPGFHSGYVMLSDDDLAADNEYFFSFYIPENFNILLVGDDALDTRLINLALAPDEKLRRHWLVTPASYESLGSIRLREYDVVIFTNFEKLRDSDLNRMREYVRNGGGLLVNAGQKSDSAMYNQQLSELTGVTMTSSFPKRYSRTGFYILSEFDRNHPILSVFEKKADSPDLNFKSYAIIKTTLRSDAEPQLMARFSDGSPGITVNRFGRGWVMYMGCDINPEISDISMHPFFVPFLVRTCEFLSSGFSATSENIYTGQSPRREIRKSFSVTNEFELSLPDGSRRIVNAESIGNIRSVECGSLNQSGIYHIMNGSTESDCFAVNIPVEESDIYRTDWDNLENRLSARQLPHSADLAGFVSEQRFGRELWHYFIFAALLLMVIEMVLARDRRTTPASE